MRSFGSSRPSIDFDRARNPGTEPGFPREGRSGRQKRSPCLSNQTIWATVPLPATNRLHPPALQPLTVPKVPLSGDQTLVAAGGLGIKRLHKRIPVGRLFLIEPSLVGGPAFLFRS